MVGRFRFIPQSIIGMFEGIEGFGKGKFQVLGLISFVNHGLNQIMRVS